ncbi:hypothetical protein SDC9_141049 [bioreactor metagenome]|uniref:Uncharacterized protein n=1 Tax=bioreactor metagenome TaxID=1076179 RepID=A0A645DX04_9ZZZZ
MEGALHRDDPGPAGAPGELEAGVVGLRAGVAEEHPGRDARGVGGGQRVQPLGELHLPGAGEEVGDVRDGGDLVADRGDDVGVGMTQ